MTSPLIEDGPPRISASEACCAGGAEPPLRPDEAARYATVLKAVADPLPQVVLGSR